MNRIHLIFRLLIFPLDNPFAIFIPWRIRTARGLLDRPKGPTIVNDWPCLPWLLALFVHFAAWLSPVRQDRTWPSRLESADPS